jgi:hypothetical protein
VYYNTVQYLHASAVSKDTSPLEYSHCKALRTRSQGRPAGQYVRREGKGREGKLIGEIVGEERRGERWAGWEGKGRERSQGAAHGIELFKAKKERQWGSLCPWTISQGVITFLALLELLAVLADLIQSIEQLRHAHPCAPHHALALIVLSVSFTVTISLTATTILKKLGRWREKVRERKSKRAEKECEQEEAKRIEWKGEEWAREHERRKWRQTKWGEKREGKGTEGEGGERKEGKERQRNGREHTEEV